MMDLLKLICLTTIKTHIRSSILTREMKKNVLYNFASRTCTFVLNPEVRKKRLFELVGLLFNRRYHREVIEVGVKKAPPVSQVDLRSKQDEKKNMAIPCITSNNPTYNDNKNITEPFFVSLKQESLKDKLADVRQIKGKRHPPNLNK